MVGSAQIGQITPAAWSPRRKRNVGLSVIERGYQPTGQAVLVHRVAGILRPGALSNLPFDWVVT
ncbi:MAG: hypothetical protein LH632_20505 [Rhodoferax sp.]|nr:hypothetical protein [Rhodoferax sp.]